MPCGAESHSSIEFLRMLKDERKNPEVTGRHGLYEQMFFASVAPYRGWKSLDKRTDAIYVSFGEQDFECLCCIHRVSFPSIYGCTPKVLRTKKRGRVSWDMKCQRSKLYIPARDHLTPEQPPGSWPEKKQDLPPRMDHP